MQGKAYKYTCPRCRQTILDVLSELRNAGASREVIKEVQKEWLIKIRRGNYWKAEAENDIFCTNKDIRNTALWCCYTLSYSDFRKFCYGKKKFPVHQNIYDRYWLLRKENKTPEKICAQQVADEFGYKMSTILRIVHTRGVGN